MVIFELVVILTGDIMSFGTRLQNLRKENRISQEELAEKLDVSRQAISRWENDNGYPEVEKLIQIAEIFNASMDYLIKGDVSEPEDSSEQNTATSYDILDVYINSRFINVRYKASGLLLLMLTVPLSAGLGNMGILLSLVLLIAGIIFIVIGRQKDKGKKTLPNDIFLGLEAESIIKEEISKMYKRCNINLSLGIILFAIGIANLFIFPSIFDESLLWMFNNHRYFIITTMMFLIAGILQVVISTMQRNVYKYVSDRFKISLS